MGLGLILNWINFFFLVGGIKSSAEVRVDDGRGSTEPFVSCEVWKTSYTLLVHCCATLLFQVASPKIISFERLLEGPSE